jgi:hypothetical protein
MPKAMKKVITALCFLLFLSILNAQQGLKWERSIGGNNLDFYFGNVITRGGTIIKIGTTLSNNGDCIGNHGGYDVLLTALNANGTTSWNKIIGGADNEGAGSIDTLADGNIIAGFSYGSIDGDILGNHSNSSDVAFQKYTPAGQLIWSKIYGGNGAEELKQVKSTPDGGCIAIGSTNSSNTGDVGPNHSSSTLVDVWIIKLDAAGNLQWQKCFGGDNDDFGDAIELAPGGGYYFAATVTSLYGDLAGLLPANTVIAQDIWLSKISSAGIIEWSRQIGGTLDEAEPHLCINGPSVYLLFGTNSSDRDITANAGTADAAIFKYNSSGTLLWKKIYGSPSYEGIGSLALYKNYLGVVIDNFSPSFGGFPIPDYGSGSNIILAFIDTLSGNLQSVKGYGGSLREFAYDCKINSTNQIVIAGTSESNDHDINGNHGDFDAITLVVDADMITALARIPELDKSITIYPNPVNQSEFYVVNKEGGRYFRNWRLYNSQGKVVGQQRIGQNGIQNLTIKSSHLTSGVYFLQLETNRGVSFRRVVVIH